MCFFAVSHVENVQDNKHVEDRTDFIFCTSRASKIHLIHRKHVHLLHSTILIYAMEEMDCIYVEFSRGYIPPNVLSQNKFPRRNSI